MTDHESYMRMALEQAHLARTMGEVPVGAVVVKEGRVIAACPNRRETDGDPTAHAEILALREAARVLSGRRLLGCTLYVTLEPCPMCAGALVLSQADACVFGASDPKQGCGGSIYDLLSDPAFSHRVRVIGGILEEESAALLSAFFTSRRA